MLKRASALHTLIRQRHLTPSCGGHVPYRGENSKDVCGELDPSPGIREQPGSYADIDPVTRMSASPPKAEVSLIEWNGSPIGNGSATGNNRSHE
jgi:hypothetical protein